MLANFKRFTAIGGLAVIIGLSFSNFTGNTAHASEAWYDTGEKRYSWIVRARLLGIYPTGESTPLEPLSAGVSGLAEVEAQEDYVPELDITYMLTKHIGVELILGVSKHQISSKGSVLAALSPGTIADVWLLPPTITLQYHFNPDGHFRPYVGVGVNITLPFDEEVNSVLTAGTGITGMEIDTSVGIALQAGFDYQITEKWFFNADVKWIHLEPDVKLTGSPLGTQTFEAEINPIIVGFGIGMRF